ncbi:hypothetical protein G9A89_022507 [Geosiphon pyriformis]|nr:hypothetical protein G9A89_022507 [Geosiphon pyriformis]
MQGMRSTCHLRERQNKGKATAARHERQKMEDNLNCTLLIRVPQSVKDKLKISGQEKMLMNTKMRNPKKLQYGASASLCELLYIASECARQSIREYNRRGN